MTVSKFSRVTSLHYTGQAENTDRIASISPANTGTNRAA
jgi:hypothetical protein